MRIQRPYSKDPESPEQLGKYKIIRRLATGGMAEIYLASMNGLEGVDKLVVIKRILPKLASDVEYVQMFLNEARVVARLSHPNIVHFHDIESRQGEFFIAMEFLHGADVLRILRTAAARGRSVPIETTLTIILGVCAGLHYAHEKTGADGCALNIIHRDISPQNVFVTFDGGVKLLDFGIAKASSQIGVTRRGTLKGKISYMSPEQARGDPLDRSSDIFSLCIVLWELTTRRRLFRGPNDYEVLKRLLECDIPRPSTVVPDFPPDLDQIIMKGLKRRREEHYATVEELQIDLEKFGREGKLAVSPLSLTRLMKEFFGDENEAWNVAQRERTTNPALLAKIAGSLPWLRKDDGGEDTQPDWVPSTPVLPNVSAAAATIRFRLARPRTVAALLVTGAVLCVAALVLNRMAPSAQLEHAPVAVPTSPRAVRGPPAPVATLSPLPTPEPRPTALEPKNKTALRNRPALTTSSRSHAQAKHTVNEIPSAAADDDDAPLPPREQ